MKRPAPFFRRGERVLLRNGDEVVAGEVLLASSNGQSIAVGFDGIMAGCVNMVPLLWDPAASTFRTIVAQVAIDVRKLATEARQ